LDDAFRRGEERLENVGAVRALVVAAIRKRVPRRPGIAEARLFLPLAAPDALINHGAVVARRVRKESGCRPLGALGFELKGVFSYIIHLDGLVGRGSTLEEVVQQQNDVLEGVSKDSRQ